MGTSSTTATDLLPKGTPTSATPSGANLPSGPSNLPPGLSYGPSSLGDAGTGPASTPPPTPTPMPSYTPPDAAIQHLPFLDPPSPSSNELPSTGTGKGSEVHNLWQPHKNEPVSFTSTQPDSPSAAQTSRDQIQAWKSRVEAQTQQQAKAAAPAPTPKPMSVTPKRPSPLSAEARASNGRLAEAMARASDPTQILPILKDAQDIDPVQFKAEFQDISDQLWQNLPAHRREAAHQDFMTQAKRALGWDQAQTRDTGPTQSPHPEAKDPTQRVGQVAQQPASAEAQPTTATTPAQQTTPGTPQGAASGDQTKDPSQPPASNPQSDSVPKSYEVQRNPHTGDAYLYDAKTRDLVRTADGTPATIGDVAMPVTENDVKATQHRDQVMTDVLARLRDTKILKPDEAQELLQKVAETYPYAPAIQEKIDYMLKAHQTSISKDNKDVSVDTFERLHQQLKDPSFQAKYEQNRKFLEDTAQTYEGGVGKYISDRGHAVETMDEAAISVIEILGEIQEHDAKSVKDNAHSQKSAQLEKRLKESWDELVPRVDELGEFLNLPHPDAALGMENEFKAAETAGQRRQDLLQDLVLTGAGFGAGSLATRAAGRLLSGAGRSAATAEIGGIGAGLLASGAATAADVVTAYRSSIQDSYTKVLQSVKNPDGTLPDLSNSKVRQKILAENPDLRKQAAQTASMKALATLLGDRLGALSGTIARVIKPEIGNFGEFGVNEIFSRSLEQSLNRSSKD